MVAVLSAERFLWGKRAWSPATRGGEGNLCCSHSVNSVGQYQVFVFNSHHSNQGSGEGGNQVADIYI